MENNSKYRPNLTLRGMNFDLLKKYSNKYNLSINEFIRLVMNINLFTLEYSNDNLKNFEFNNNENDFNYYGYKISNQDLKKFFNEMIQNFMSLYKTIDFLKIKDIPNKKERFKSLYSKEKKIYRTNLRKKIKFCKICKNTFDQKFKHICNNCKSITIKNY